MCNKKFDSNSVFTTWILELMLIFLREELDINNFFSFLAAMMLAYQPVRSLATLNMGLNQGIQSAKRVLPIIAVSYTHLTLPTICSV